MTDRLATTPFGGGRMRADIFAVQQRTATRQAQIAAGDGEVAKADKWELMRALVDVRVRYGLSDRALTVLDALLSFHPERVLDGRRPIVVFPSNHELSQRSRGMSGATLRRHIAALVAAGLLMRRDSPNGKRYCRRNGEGRLEEAFGFDLAPLALAAGRIRAEAEAARAEAKALRILRAEITLHLRDIAKTLRAALDDARPGDWSDYADRLQALSGRLSRAADHSGLIARRDGLLRLRLEIETAYLEGIEPEEMSACDAENERHIQNSESEISFERKGDGTDLKRKDGNTGHGCPENGPTVTLHLLLSTCPTIRDYARNGIGNWRDALATADLVRSMLRISDSAWRDALAVFGETGAIAVIAAILERADAIRSPGGYLRDLTRKGREGRFTIHPMLHALKSAGGDVHVH